MRLEKKFARQSSDKPAVILIGQYPGGSDALSPVIKSLIELNRYGVCVIASDYAADIFKTEKIDFIQVAAADREKHVSDIFGRVKPALLVTDLIGFGINDLHYVASRIARRNHVPILGVLDSWVNYPDRFCDPLDLKPFGLLPDKIAAMNDFAVKELMDIGIPRERLAVTGQPAFDRTANIMNRQKEIGKNVRQILNIPDSVLFIVFFSENLAEIYGGDFSRKSFLGYTQDTSIRSLIDALEANRRKDLFLLIKRHPREKGDFKNFSLNGKPVLQVSHIDISPPELAAAADINIGMSSIMLFHSYLMGKKTLVIVPDKVPGVDLFVLTRIKILNALTEKKQIDYHVNCALSDDDYMEKAVLRKDWYINDGQAAKRVTDEISAMVNREIKYA